jgi:hypothetical protein
MARDGVGSETLRRCALDLALTAIPTVGVTGSDASTVVKHRRQTWVEPQRKWASWSLPATMRRTPVAVKAVRTRSAYEHFRLDPGLRSTTTTHGWRRGQYQDITNGFTFTGVQIRRSPMKSQAKKTIAVSSGAAILVLAVGFSDGGLLPSATTTTTTPSSRITPASRPPPLPLDLSLSEHPEGASRYGQTHITGEKVTSAHPHSETPDRKRARNRASLVVPKLAQRAVIADASASAIAGAVGDVDLPGQARADNPPCVADPTNSCPPPVDVSADSPSRPQPQITSPPRMQIICQPAGAVGAFCYRRIVP